jgi:hypothetical protein
MPQVYLDKTVSRKIIRGSSHMSGISFNLATILLTDVHGVQRIFGKIVCVKPISLGKGIDIA